jgi:alkylation response protein AidB-like acyl-CoA dehydrogenase
MRRQMDLEDKARHQFGRPIGSFQAVKHKLATMHVAMESARSAAFAQAGRREDVGRAAHAAKAAAVAEHLLGGGEKQ